MLFVCFVCACLLAVLFVCLFENVCLRVCDLFVFVFSSLVCLLVLVCGFSVLFCVCCIWFVGVCLCLVVVVVLCLVACVYGLWFCFFVFVFFVLLWVVSLSVRMLLFLFRDCLCVAGLRFT